MRGKTRATPGREKKRLPQVYNRALQMAIDVSSDFNIGA